jgi:hypothetical protein
VTVARGASSITVTWPEDSLLKLQSAPSISGPWTVVPGVTGNSTTLDSSTGNLYLRLGQ